MTMSNVTPFATQKAQKPSGYKMLSRGSTGEIYLYGQIGASWFGDGITAKQFSDDLKKLGKVSAIDLRINSEGGDVFDGRTMYSLLVQHDAKITVYVDGLAASIASLIAMAGDTIKMAAGSFTMVHSPWTLSMGNAADLRRTADLLDSVEGTLIDTYVARTKNDKAKIKTWLDAETWFTADEAKANGFADEVIEPLKAAASVSRPDRFRNLPAALRPNRAAALALMDRTPA